MNTNYRIISITVPCVLMALATIFPSCAGQRGIGCPSHTGKNYKVGY